MLDEILLNLFSLLVLKMKIEICGLFLYLITFLCVDDLRLFTWEQFKQLKQLLDTLPLKDFPQTHFPRPRPKQPRVTLAWKRIPEGKKAARWFMVNYTTITMKPMQEEQRNKEENPRLQLAVRLLNISLNCLIPSN